MQAGSLSYGWQQEAVAENARQIWQLGRDFYKRLNDFASHLGKVGKHLSQSVGAYNDSVGTFERRVLVSARKFKDLDPGLESHEIEVAPLDIQIRSQQIPEALGIAEIDMDKIEKTNKFSTFISD